MDDTSSPFWEYLAANLTALAILVGAVGVLVMNILTFRRAGVAIVKADKSIEVSTGNADSIKTIGENVDGKLTDLLDAREGKARAEGKLEERDAERLHLSESPVPIPVVNGSEDDPLKVKLVKDKEKP